MGKTSFNYLKGNTTNIGVCTVRNPTKIQRKILNTSGDTSHDRLSQMQGSCITTGQTSSLTTSTIERREIPLAISCQTKAWVQPLRMHPMPITDETWIS
ncbi:MAG: hypothetical protein P1U39_07660 [Legionellaceae bacterium]|nr:hypothetical protein [Legionellaceae bacterium]